MVPGFSQRATVEQSIQWFSTVANVKLSTRCSALAEGQFRYVNGFEPMQTQASTGIDVKAGARFSFMPVGYFYSWNIVYGKQPAAFSNNEHRLFQQLKYVHPLGGISVEHRFRLEQRFIQVHEIENGEVIDKGYALYFSRVRYRLSLKTPLVQANNGDTKLYVTLYDELFMDFGSSVVHKDPDQNRFYAGPGFNASKNIGILVGFVYQTLIKQLGDRQENNIGFQVTLQYNLDLVKAKKKPSQI